MSNRKERAGVSKPRFYYKHIKLLNTSIELYIFDTKLQLNKWYDKNFKQYGHGDMSDAIAMLIPYDSKDMIARVLFCKRSYQPSYVAHEGLHFAKHYDVLINKNHYWKYDYHKIRHEEKMADYVEEFVKKVYPDK